jgi:ribosomal protein L7/L12
MPKITLRRWRPGLQKISLTKILQESAGLSLTAAKESVDRFLAGEQVAVSVITPEEAARIAEAIMELGVDCEVDNGDQTER